MSSLGGVITRATSAAPQPKRPSYWPLWVIGSGCFVAIWGGWVGLGGLTGFGPVQLFPGIWDSFRPNTAITLPLSMEVYGSYALRWWIDKRTPERARRYAMWTSISALGLGLLGQGGYHLMEAHHFTPATTPWAVTVLVAWVPVIAFGLGAGLRHMLNETEVPAAVPDAELSPQAAAAPAPGPAVVHVHAAPAGAPWGLAPAAAPVPELVPVPAPAAVSLPFPLQVAGPSMSLADRPKRAPRQRATTSVSPDRRPLPADEAALAALVRSMTRNDLYRQYQVSKHGADKLREQYLNEEVKADAAA